MSFTFMVPNVQNVQEMRKFEFVTNKVETNGTFTIYFSELCALVSCVQANNCQALYSILCLGAYNFSSAGPKVESSFLLLWYI